MIFDVHAHYDDEQFDVDRESILNGLKKNGVKYVVNAGASLESSYKSIELANEYDFIYATVGVHPEEAYDLPNDYIDILEKYAEDDKVVGIGEIGLDYHGDDFVKDVQKRVFIEQARLAKKLNLPVIVHDRDAHGDTMDILKNECVTDGILHCFSGSVEMAREVINMGMYISVGGVLTFKNAKKLLEVVEDTPIERILLETDCPYLAPTPFRGKRNNSSYIRYVIQKLSEIKGINEVDVESITLRNAMQVFNILS